MRLDGPEDLLCLNVALRIRFRGLAATSEALDFRLSVSMIAEIVGLVD